MYDEALKLAIEDLNKIDSSIFKNIYLYLLERIIYIYIQKEIIKVLTDMYTLRKM